MVLFDFVGPTYLFVWIYSIFILLWHWGHNIIWGRSDLNRGTRDMASMTRSLIEISDQVLTSIFTSYCPIK